MLDELKEKIEIFTGHEVHLIPRQEVYNLDLPQEWKDLLGNSSRTIPEVIRQLWHPISNQAKDMIDTLAAQIIDIAVVSSPAKEESIQICYVFQITAVRFGQTYLNCWVAGMPMAKKELPENVNLDLPPAYEKFCGVHNGFLLNGNFSIGFLPVERLKMLVAKDKKKKLLCFCGDGLGNNRCFDFSKPLDVDGFMTVDLDHETLEVGHPLPFWEFANKFVAANTKAP